MTVRIYHNKKKVEEPEWKAIKLRRERETHYHLALHSKHKKHMHLSYKIGKSITSIPVLIDHAHTRNPEEFWGHIISDGENKYLVIKYLPRFVAHQIIIDINAVDKAAREAKTDMEFQRLVKELKVSWKVDKNPAAKILLAHLKDIIRLARESKHVIKEFELLTKIHPRDVKDFKKN